MCSGSFSSEISVRIPAPPALLIMQDAARREPENGPPWKARFPGLACNHGSSCRFSPRPAYLFAAPACSLLFKGVRLGFSSSGPNLPLQRARCCRSPVQTVCTVQGTALMWPLLRGRRTTSRASAGRGRWRSVFEKKSVWFCHCAFSLIDRMNIEPSVVACVKQIA